MTGASETSRAPVIAAHNAVDAMINGLSIDDLLAGGMGEGPQPAQVALKEALAIRAASPAELRFRLNLLNNTLRHEEASEYALDLLNAAIADLDALHGAADTLPTVPPLELVHTG